MDYSLQNHKSFIGKHVSDLPTPAFVLSKPTLEANIKEMLDDVDKAGVSFRPHVKTLKSLEATRLMLGNGKHRKAIASTLCEMQGMLPLVDEGILDECLYGLPVCPSVLPRLAALSNHIHVVLMLDCAQQVDHLEAFALARAASSAAAPPPPPKWHAFIKVDVGYSRAGIPLASAALQQLVVRIAGSPAVQLYGFYCHAGQSYGVSGVAEAAALLHQEVLCVVEAAKLVEQQQQRRRRRRQHQRDERLVVSVGATPTAHVVRELKALVRAHLELELHAGNFLVNDLQQLSTRLIHRRHLAVRILAEVCSLYPYPRNQALLNAGVIALTRESSAPFPGHGMPADARLAGWSVVRVSQEHGVLGWTGVRVEHAASPAKSGGAEEEEEEEEEDDEDGPRREEPAVESVVRIGDKVLLYCQHACITASNFHVYYVVDGADVVVETWVPWKGW